MNNLDYIKDRNLEKVIYRIGTTYVCLLLDDNHKKIIARGVSICSPRDQFVKRTGMDKAVGMAVRAFYNLDSSGKTPSKCSESNVFDYMSEYLPVPTEHEAELLTRMTKNGKKEETTT